MIVAIDKTSGKVLGQVTTVRRPSIPEMLNLPNPAPHLTILAGGSYLTIPERSVYLEEVA